MRIDSYFFQLHTLSYSSLWCSLTSGESKSVPSIALCKHQRPYVYLNSMCLYNIRRKIWISITRIEVTRMSYWIEIWPALNLQHTWRFETSTNTVSWTCGHHTHTNKQKNLLLLPHYWSSSAYWFVQPLRYNFTLYSCVCMSPAPAQMIQFTSHWLAESYALLWAISDPLHSYY